MRRTFLHVDDIVELSGNHVGVKYLAIKTVLTVC